jgi:hypothetical protein
VGGKELEVCGVGRSPVFEDVVLLLEVSDEKLCRLVVDSSEIDLESALGGGLASAGVRAFRKSVYALGGVMGVLRVCSCFITAETHAESGVSTISDGKDALLGVCSGGSTGFVVVAVAMLSTLSERTVDWVQTMATGECRRGPWSQARERRKARRRRSRLAQEKAPGKAGRDKQTISGEEHTTSRVMVQ